MATKCGLAALCAFGLALIFVRLLVGSRLANLVVDVPNHRSLHLAPTPRTGGLGLMVAALIAWKIFGSGALPVFVIIAGLLTMLFAVDDVRGLPVIVRFAAQAIAAAALITWIDPLPWLLIPILFVGVVWSANLYNFMDGSNGLAGGMAVIGFAALALAALKSNAGEIALVAAVIAGASGGFLVWNFDPARIFLGDAGSIPLGFLAAALGVIGWQTGAFPFWLPLLAFSPFWVDATLTLLQRVRRGEKLSDAHRSHYYQRLIRMGWSHRRLALSAYALMFSTAATAVLAMRAKPLAVAALLIWWAAVFVALATFIDWRWQQHEQGQGRRVA